MLFDLALGGHHGNYIQYLIDDACQQPVVSTIDIVVLPQFLEMHRDTVAAIAIYHQPTINIVPIAAEEVAALGDRSSGLSRLQRNFREWQIFCKYARNLQTTHALMMYLDTCELPLAVGMQSPCPFSGIYFRPTFHYGIFANYHPDFKERLKQWRNRFTLDRILAHPQLQTVFCLDPFAVEALTADGDRAKIVPLADPVRSSPSTSLDLATYRTQLGIETDRRVFLLFGALDGRKGIYQLLEAIELLPPALSQQMCLLLVGKTNAAERVNIEQKIAALRQNAPIQIIECYDFIPEDEVIAYFQLADVVLAPYQRHIGMSGILLLAAAAGKPVLSTDYGLMGELVRRYRLGLAVDATQPPELMQALARCLTAVPATLGDRSQMQVFADLNSIDRYASTIFQYLDPATNGDTPTSIGSISARTTKKIDN
jgi:glycosyltransferase involved in cell wall biosynthesis